MSSQHVIDAVSHDDGSCTVLKEICKTCDKDPANVLEQFLKTLLGVPSLPGGVPS